MSTNNSGEEKTPAGSNILESLPPAIFQAVYHAATGKTERLAKTYRVNKIVSRENIVNLAHKFNQFTDQYNCVGKNVEITLRHEDKETNKFSSIFTFERYDTTGSSRISDVEISFNFCIQLPNQNKYQNYKIDVNIQSTGFSNQKEQRNYIISYYGIPPIFIDIEYVDFVVSKALQSVIDGWVSSLDDLKISPVLSFLKSKYDMWSVADAFGVSTRILTVIFAAHGINKANSHLGEIKNFSDLFNRFLLSGLFIYCLIWVVAYFRGIF
jgi:hypothetical protein